MADKTFRQLLEEANAVNDSMDDLFQLEFEKLTEKESETMTVKQFLFRIHERWGIDKVIEGD